MKKFITLAAIALVSSSSVFAAEAITLKKMAFACPNNSHFFDEPTNNSIDQENYKRSAGCVVIDKEIKVGTANKTKLSAANVYVFPGSEIGNASGKTFAVLIEDTKKN